MGGEWFHFKKIISDQKNITEEALKEYTELLPKFIETVKVWWNSLPSNQKSGWEVKANLPAGVYIKSPGELFEEPIVMETLLNNSFNIGWQHRRYGSCRDPKEDIAEKLFTIINHSNFLKKCIIDWEMFERHEIYESYPSDSEEFTPEDGFY